MSCVPTSCSTTFLQDPVTIALLVVYSIVPACIGLFMASVRHATSPPRTGAWVRQAVLADFHDDAGELRSLLP